MEQGSLSERHLTAAVHSEIRKISKDMLVGAAVGNDYASIGGVVSADGMGETPDIAWNKAYNNFLCSAGHCEAARILLMLPANSKQSTVQSAMKRFAELAEVNGVQIVGGHSQVTENIKEPMYYVTLMGKQDEWKPCKSQIKAGMDIVMVGFAGMLGTDLLLEQFRSRLEERFSANFLHTAHFGTEKYSYGQAINVLKANGLLQKVFYMHDISCGGVYSALWQLGKWMDKGLRADNKAIPIKQETIEICEFLDCNPYLLEGTGAMLLICESGRDILNTLQAAGIDCAIIGKVTENKERQIVLTEEDIRTLAPAEGDALYSI